MTTGPVSRTHPQHEIAARQMDDFGAMISIDMGDFDSATRLMDGLSMCSLAVSLQRGHPGPAPGLDDPQADVRGGQAEPWASRTG